MVDAGLQDLLGIGFERSIKAQCARERRRADAVYLYTQLGQRSIKSGNGGKHANRTGDGVGTADDFIGRRSDVVATGSGQITHGRHDGLAGRAQGLHFAIDLFGGHDTATGTIDAQHHSLDTLVFTRLAQQCGRGVTAHRARRLIAIENLAAGHDDTDRLASRVVQTRLGV